MKPTHRLTYRTLRLISHQIGRLTPHYLYRFSVKLAQIIFRYYPHRQSQAISNLRSALPNISNQRLNKILQKVYTLFILEFLRFVGSPRTYRRIPVDCPSLPVLDSAVQENKGVILVTGHFGSWEMLVHWLSSKGYPMTGVAQRQRNKGAHQFINEQRAQFGSEPIYRKRATRAMHAALESNRIFVLVSDQDARKHGIFVKFFDRYSSTHRGAATFHKRTGAPILFVTAYHQQDPQRYQVDFKRIPSLDSPPAATIVQHYTWILETYIRTYPDQYFWFHRRWKTAPPKNLVPDTPLPFPAPPRRILADDPALVPLAREVLAAGGIIVYPTDTLYGFGVDASQPQAVEKLNRLKHRSGPLSVLAPDKLTAQRWSRLPEIDQDIIDKYLKPKSTLIIPVESTLVADTVSGPDNSLGLRCSDHPVSVKLTRNYSAPITSTSVNRSGNPPLNDPDEILAEFGSSIDLLIDAGTLPPASGSTIYKFERGQVVSIR